MAGTVVAVGAIPLLGCFGGAQGDGAAGGEESIINGAAVSNATRVTQGLVGVDVPGGSCSASLYKNDWVMTAWHCLAPVLPTGANLTYMDNVNGNIATRFSTQFIRVGFDGALIRANLPFTFNGTTTGLRRAVGTPVLNEGVTCYGRGANGFAPGGGVTGGGTWRTADFSVADAGDNGNTFHINNTASGQIIAPGDSGGPCVRTSSPATLLGVNSTAGCSPGPTCGNATSINGGDIQKVGFEPWLDNKTSTGVQPYVVRYGSNCSGQVAVEQDVWNTCRGATECDYRVDHTRIGDPAVGCAKNFRAWYFCSGSDSLRYTEVAPEASGQVARLSCSGITIVRATYGFNLVQLALEGGLTSNATSKVAQACNGSRSCTYNINVNDLGDPAFGKEKSFHVEYICDGAWGSRVASAPPEAHGRSVTLSCP